MSIPIAPSIEIPAEVYPILKRISQSGKTEKRLVDRANFVLRMGEGMANLRIAKEFRVESNTVKKWRTRWLDGTKGLKQIIAASELADTERAKRLGEEVEKILSDKPRPGVAMTYTAQQYCQILQVALEPPSKSGRPINDWTPKELADEVNKRGICQKISASQVRRFLKRCGHQTASSQLLAESETRTGGGTRRANRRDL
jgi:transposase